MVRTETDIKLMAIFIRGDIISDRQLAVAIGFKNHKNIAKHLSSFVNSGYVVKLSAEGTGPGNWYRLTKKKEDVLKLYQSNFFRGLRVQIRQIPWFVDEIGQGYRDLPPDLFEIILGMMKKSHSFFSLIVRCQSHRNLVSLYSIYLFPCRLFEKDDLVFQSYFLYAQLYAESVMQDIEKGGLDEGFMHPLDMIREKLFRMVQDSGIKSLPAGDVADSDWENRDL